VTEQNSGLARVRGLVGIVVILLGHGVQPS
jgi:hypothetical protein